MYLCVRLKWIELSWVKLKLACTICQRNKIKLRPPKTQSHCRERQWTLLCWHLPNKSTPFTYTHTHTHYAYIIYMYYTLYRHFKNTDVCMMCIRGVCDENWLHLVQLPAHRHSFPTPHTYRFFGGAFSHANTFIETYVILSFLVFFFVFFVFLGKSLFIGRPAVSPRYLASANIRTHGVSLCIRLRWCCASCSGVIAVAFNVCLLADLVPFPYTYVGASLIPHAHSSGFGMQIFYACFHVCASAMFRHKFMLAIFYYTQIIFWLPHLLPRLPSQNPTSRS